LLFELNDITLFKHLDTTQLNDIRQQLFIKKYVKESIVFFEGDQNDYLHVLLKGSVQMYKTDPKGSQIYIHEFHAPDIIAIFATLKNIPFPATCECTSDVVVGRISFKKLQEYMKDINFSQSVISILGNKMELIANLLETETTYSSEAKIAKLIYDDISIFARLKNNEIANILNITPETLSRTLTKFKKEKILQKGYAVVLLDKNKLTQIIKTNTMSFQ